MAHVSTSEQGTITSASTQLAQEFFFTTVLANQTQTTPFLLTRGAPRILVHANQTVGAGAAAISIQASISDDDTGNQKPLTIRTFLSPILTPVSVEIPIPSKFVRLSLTAPAGNAVTVELAIMAAQ